MRFHICLTVVVVYAVFGPFAASRSFIGESNQFVVPIQGHDWGLRTPLKVPLPSSIFLSTLKGLRKTTKKRTAMGMDLTDYLWSKAHEKHRAMMLQRMMKNGRR